MAYNSFLSDFLMITDIKTIMFITVIIGVFFTIRVLERKKVKFTTRTIYATVIGLVLGLIIQAVAGFPDNPSEITWLNEISKWYSLVGSGFMDLLKMLVVPLIFISILKVIIDMGEGKDLKHITFRTVAMLILTTALASIVGIIVANVMQLGTNFNAVAGETEIREVSPLVDTLRSLLPSNVIESMAQGNVVAIIIFAAFLGIAVRRQSKKYYDIVKPFINLVEAFHKIMISVAMTVIKFMPYAVVAMLANTITSSGITSMISVMKFIAALYISVVIVFLIHLIIITLNGLSPIKYLKNAFEQLILAFTSRSSLGTLPVTIKTLTEKQGVNEEVSSLTASLGANMGMNGCAGIYPALMAVTIANMAGIETDMGFYITLVIVISISSLGIAGLPGTATMSVSVVLSGMGLGTYFPLASGILAIDPILDMGRTMLNVNGSSVTSITVAKLLNKINKEIFNK
ncbi:cation:dicarboxylate symporter family transporter [Clostridium sp. HCP1S3_B4]|uniref:cation:dicarboxylate symporter family transporter n=1 Tax=unclassified Clostridium TaxID=2614128 RepID=UPI002A7AFEE4|nr:cation:dicarboxylase symporter family transporter [Clostridium sp.]